MFIARGFIAVRVHSALFLQAIVKEVDRNMDGQISFDEFKAALAKNPK